MGRFFDGPWALFLMALVFVVAVLAIVLIAVAKSRTKDQSALGVVGPRPFTEDPSAAEGGTRVLPQQAYLQGMNHRSTATIYGVIGLFILGILFGPLALIQANKAEALGVKATAGRILGWTGIIFAILWLIFFALGIPRR